MVAESSSEVPLRIGVWSPPTKDGLILELQAPGDASCARHKDHLEYGGDTHAELCGRGVSQPLRAPDIGTTQTH